MAILDALAEVHDDSLRSTFSRPSAESAAMAAAYQGATEGDAKLVRNATANPALPNDESKSIQFYLIPSVWMSACGPFLKGNATNRPSKKIHNLALLAGESTTTEIEITTKTPSSSDDESSNDHCNEDENCSIGNSTGIHEDTDTPKANENGSDRDEQSENARRRQVRREQWLRKETKNKALSQRQRNEKLTLRSGLELEKDFLLVGPNVWTLLSEKFGYDVHLPCPTVFPATNNSSNSNKMTVEIQIGTDSIVVPIPSTRTLLDNTTSAVASASFSTTANRASNENVSVVSNQSTNDIVSEDDDGEINDLFPSVDNIASHTQVITPVLLLPPSTTASSLTTVSEESEHNNSKLYASSEEMECESDGNGKASTGVQQIVATNKRKRYGSGLGNLGNTCFMNSTLQCLAHTQPLRRYFISGDYQRDLNSDNPLGTGGELATQFAELLMEMWGTNSDKNQAAANSSNGYSHGQRQPYVSASSSSSTLSSIVYPRNFKNTLGKHAEQFLGYDQHDSQELATYLLDALHEDTNRVTKKPYIEKPEQGESESDNEAAEKAWGLHIQREDSRVLENFMGQVKSRVQCPTESCKRISTTFDPFMYLSVPIPGAMDRSLTVTYVPLDPTERMRTLTVTLNRTSVMSDFQKAIVDQLALLDEATYKAAEPLQPEDLCLTDFWSNEIYCYYKPDDEIEKIRDTDTTYAFQLRSVESIRSEECNDEEEVDIECVENSIQYRCHRSKLNIDTQSKLNKGDEWMETLQDYVRKPTYLNLILNPKRGTLQEQTKFYLKMLEFTDLLHSCSDAVESASDSTSSFGTVPFQNDASDEIVDSDQVKRTLQECSEASTVFKDVRTSKDLAVLELCLSKLRLFILRSVKENEDVKHKDGFQIQVVFQRKVTPAANSRYSSSNHNSGADKTFTGPLLLRIPSSMTVYGFREELSKRLSRSLTISIPAEMTNVISTKFPLKSEAPIDESNNNISVGNEKKAVVELGSSGNQPRSDVVISSVNSGSPELLIMRKIPMTSEKKSGYSTYKSSSSPNNPTLGMLERNDTVNNGSDEITLAMPSNADENLLLSEVVGPNGTVYLHWSTELSEQYFDVDEYEAHEELQCSKPSVTGSNVVTVSECIEKYCQIEQLEATEMWYCNRCKEHVRAWKQFHLYRAPPILIVHLKRFHFSATTHRRDKIDAYIDFPLKGLDLTKEVMHWTEEGKPVYDCYAVSNHYGGLGGGHYTAYALSDDGKWCHFDDSRVTTDVDPEDVKSKAAYVLYYRRRDVVSNSDDLFEQAAPSIVQNHSDGSHTAARFLQEINRESIRSRVEEMEVDNVEIDGSRRSSHTSSSPMGSIEREDSSSVQPYWEGGDNDTTQSHRDDEWSDTEKDYPPQ